MTSPSGITLQPFPRRTRPVTAHPAFPVLFGIWGAGIGALAVMVLPDSLIEAATTAAASDVLISEARLALSGALGVMLGLGCLMLGQLAGRRHCAALKARSGYKSRLIDPVADLGSASLDAPLGLKKGAWTERGKDHKDDVDADSPANDTAWLPVFLGEVQDEATSFEAASAAKLASPPAAASDDQSIAPPPREVDLSTFAQLPGRNAVWVEEPVSPMAQAPTAAAPHSDPAPRPAPSAIARLRAVPPTQLSLCEMVERLAAALQEYQADHSDAASEAAQGSAGEREALLEEALGALGKVTARGMAEQEPTSSPALRAAMWANAHETQNARGAA